MSRTIRGIKCNAPSPLWFQVCEAAYSNATPIRCSVRHATRQETWRPSGDMIRVKRSGIPTELVTWSIAPAFDLSRSMQLIQPLSN